MKIAHIINRRKSKWREVSKKLVEKRINYTKARVVRNGIEVER